MGTGRAHRMAQCAVTFHRYVALGDSFTEGVGDPDPARPNGLRGWADRVAEVLAHADRRLRLRQPRHPRPQARPHRRRAGRRGPRPRARPDHHPRRRQRRAPPARRHRRPRQRRTTTRSRGSPRPARTSSCSPSSTRAPAGSTARCAAGWRSSTSGSARSPTATARRVVDMWRMRDIEIAGVMDTDRMHLNARGHTHLAHAVLEAHRRRARPRPRHRRPAPRPRAPRDLGRQRPVDPRVPRALGAPPAHRPLVRRHRLRRSIPALSSVRPQRSGSIWPAVSGRHCGCSSVGRARPSQGRCREFESRHPLHVRLPQARPERWPSPHSRPAECRSRTARRRAAACRRTSGGPPTFPARGMSLTHRSSDRSPPPRSPGWGRSETCDFWGQRGQ